MNRPTVWQVTLTMTLFVALAVTEPAKAAVTAAEEGRSTDTDKTVSTVASTAASPAASTAASPDRGRASTIPTPRPDGPVTVNIPGQPEGLETFESRASYAIGVSLAGGLRGAPFELSHEQVIAGLTDALKGALKLDARQLSDIMAQVTEMTNAAIAEREAAAAAQVAAVFASHAAREGVQVTETGLQYEVLVAGDGPVPTLADTVWVNFKATSLEGEQFASNPAGEPAAFDVAGAIPAWREALLMMPVGSTWRLLAPSALALGREGGGGVPPDMPLFFEIELVGIHDRSIPE